MKIAAYKLVKILHLQNRRSVSFSNCLAVANHTVFQVPFSVVAVGH